MSDAARLNLIVLRVANLDRSEEFYSLLGLRFVRHRHGRGPEHLSAEEGSCVLELYPASAEGALSLGTRLGFEVTSLDAVMAAAAAQLECVISGIHDSPWGRRAVLADPDGHRVELVETRQALTFPVNQ